MLKSWRVPLCPDWINAENTIISLVTFQIQISNSNFKFSNFQIQNKLFCLPVFVAKHIFKTHQHFCFLCFHSRWRLFFLPWQKIISAKENFRALAWTLAKFYLRERVAKRIFKTHKHFCFLCFHSRWRFFWFHKDRENTKHLFTLAENNFGDRKLSCTRLNFGETLFAGTKRAVPGGQYRSILPARVAHENTEFAAYCPLEELAI